LGEAESYGTERRMRMRPKLTYANVMATIAVFIALGGASYAALKLPKNSVGTKQLKKNAVTAAKIKNEAVTAAKVQKGTLTGTQINASTLGTVPNAENAQTAQKANALSPGEAWHVVGAPGEPAFLNSWADSSSGVPKVAFYRDHEGVVHLMGLATGGSEAVFQLPPGFRPAANTTFQFPMGCAGGGSCASGVGEGYIIGSGTGANEGAVITPPGASIVKLDGITFRAES
jgi:hypothetical protein